MIDLLNYKRDPKTLYIWPNIRTYIARSIRDFAEDERIIKPTKDIIPPAIWYWGTAKVYFAERTVYRFEDDEHVLSDMTAIVSTKIIPKGSNPWKKVKEMSKEKIRDLRDGDVLMWAKTVYDTGERELYLYDYGRFGSPRTEAEHMKIRKLVPEFG